MRSVLFLWQIDCLKRFRFRKNQEPLQVYNWSFAATCFSCKSYCQCLVNKRLQIVMTIKVLLNRIVTFSLQETLLLKRFRVLRRWRENNMSSRLLHWRTLSHLRVMNPPMVRLLPQLLMPQIVTSCNCIIVCMHYFNSIFGNKGNAY